MEYTEVKRNGGECIDWDPYYIAPEVSIYRLHLCWMPDNCERFDSSYEVPQSSK